MSNTKPEPTRLRVLFHDRPLGEIAYSEKNKCFALQFAQSFLGENHDLSPLHLPLEKIGGKALVFRERDSPFAGGLPGLIADSLPDRWGQRMIDREVPGICRTTTLGKLAAIGSRGPGAISFEPVLGCGADQESIVGNLASLADEASLIRTHPLTPVQVDAALARGGSSLGGVFPKLTTYLPLMGDDSGQAIALDKVHIGGHRPPLGHVPCILKLANAGEDAEGTVEYAFWLMARKAGIRVPPACLVNDGQRRHFACARFDRHVLPDGSVRKQHCHTLSGMLHKRPAEGGIDYEDYIRLTQTLCGVKEAEECFRRAVFNLLSTNRDDHGRNHAYLYDDQAENKLLAWKLSPAYDTNPHVANVLIALTWNHSNARPNASTEVLNLADSGGIPRSRALEIYAQVESAILGVGGWTEASRLACIPPATARAWGDNIESQSKHLAIGG